MTSERRDHTCGGPGVGPRVGGVRIDVLTWASFFDRLTERLVEEFYVPDAALPRAKELARVPADDPDAIMCYRLDASTARDLAEILNARIDTERRDYFLEGLAGS